MDNFIATLSYDPLEEESEEDESETEHYIPPKKQKNEIVETTPKFPENLPQNQPENSVDLPEKLPMDSPKNLPIDLVEHLSTDDDTTNEFCYSEKYFPSY